MSSEVLTFHPSNLWTQDQQALFHEVVLGHRIVLVDDHFGQSKYGVELKGEVVAWLSCGGESPPDPVAFLRRHLPEDRWEIKKADPSGYVVLVDGVVTGEPDFLMRAAYAALITERLSRGEESEERWPLLAALRRGEELSCKDKPLTEQ